MNDQEEEWGEAEVEAMLPCWRFSLWDVAGITLFTAGHVVNAIAQGFSHLSTQCQAAANYSRQNYDLRESERLNDHAREQIERGMRETLGLPTTLEGDR